MKSGTVYPNTIPDPKESRLTDRNENAKKKNRTFLRFTVSREHGIRTQDLFVPNVSFNLSRLFMNCQKWLNHAVYESFSVSWLFTDLG